MKTVVTQYKCNLCGSVSYTLNALVATTGAYALSAREDSDCHLCRECITRLRGMFKADE